MSSQTPAHRQEPDNHAVILGGGLAGLSLAVQLKQRQPQLAITVLERTKHPVPHAAHKVGESLVELSSHYFANVLGLKQHLVEGQLPKLGLRFFFRPDPAQDGADRLRDRVELGAVDFPTSPSYQLDRGIFENFLGATCRELDVCFADETKVLNVEIAAGEQPHRVHVEQPDGERAVLDCRWVIDACSRHSLTKRLLDVEKEGTHKVSAAWFRIGCRLDITDLHDAHEWLDGHQGDTSRWFSTNHFMGNGYWVWFIPLASGSTSIGIVADNEIHPLNTYNTLDKAMNWLERNEPLAAEFVAGKLDHLQDFRSLRNFSHDSVQVFNKNRCFATGEAGVFLDPFYSPGSDFIAISNTFICQLIDADINQPDTFRSTCVMLDKFYLNLFHNTLAIYQDLYATFRHPVVMPIKILWDLAVYWSFTAFLYIQGCFEDAKMLLKLRRHFEEIGAMNRHLQAVLRIWAEHEPDVANNLYIDPYDFDFLNELNAGLGVEFADDAAFTAKFLDNIGRLKQMYAFISQTAYRRFPEIAEQLEPMAAPNGDGEAHLEIAQYEALLNKLLKDAEVELAEA